MIGRRRYQNKNKCQDNIPGIVPLSTLAVGEKGRVIQIRCQRTQLRRRMFDMGITVGTIVEINRIAPLGDPVNINIRGYHLCLRIEDMMDIMVEVI